jgi:hypothetical protein
MQDLDKFRLSLERVTHNATGDSVDHYTMFDSEPFCKAVAIRAAVVGLDDPWRPARQGSGA